MDKYGRPPNFKRKHSRLFVHSLSAEKHISFITVAQESNPSKFDLDQESALHEKVFAFRYALPIDNNYIP